MTMDFTPYTMDLALLKIKKIQNKSLIKWANDHQQTPEELP